MFLEHFELKRKPFQPVPDTRELFQTRAHKEARARLQIAFDERLPAMLVGEAGVGKTTALRAALAELNAKTCRVIEITDPRLKLRSFYRTLAHGLGLEPRHFFGDLSEQVREACSASLEQGRFPVLVVDEAHMLPAETLDSLRLLTNPALQQKTASVGLLLIGDLALRRNLARSYFESFVQRLRVTYSMPPVDPDEARRYIAHRLRTAGGNPDIFDPAAVDAIVAEADGRLRRLDDLSTHALYAAFIRKAKVVGKDHVQEVLEERRSTRG